MANIDDVLFPEETAIPTQEAAPPTLEGHIDALLFPADVTAQETAPVSPFAGVGAGVSSGPLPGPRQDMPVATGASQFWPYGHPAAEPTAKALTNPQGWVGPRMTVPIAATAVGGALGGPPGAALGGYLGTIGGETIGQYLDSLEPGGKPFDPMGAGLTDIQWEALKGAAPDALLPLGKWGMSGARRILAPMRDKMDVLRAADRALAEKGGLTLTPGESSGSSFLLRMEDYANRYRTKAGDAFYKVRQSEMVKMVNETLSKVDSNYKLALDKYGQMLRRGTKISEQEAKAASSKLFEAPRAMIPDLAHRYPTPELATEVNSVIDELVSNQKGLVAKPGTKLNGTPRMPGELLGSVDELGVGGDAAQLIKKMSLDNPHELGEMTYDRLRAIQTAIGELKGRVSPNEWRLLSRIASASEKSMDNQIAPTTPGLMALIETARENHKLTVVKHFIESGEYKKMQDLDASLVVDSLFPPGMSKESAQRIMAIMPPEMKKTMAAGWLYNLTNLRPGMVGKEFSENVFVDNLNRYSPEVHELLLGKKAYQEIKELGETMNIPRAAKVGSRAESLVTGGSTATQLGNVIAAGTGVGGVATGAVAGGVRAGLKAMGPSLVAKLLYTPGGRKYLSEGLIPRGKALRGLGRAAIYGVGEIPAVAARMAFGDKWPLSDMREGLDIMGRDIETLMAPYARGARLANPESALTPLQKAFGASRGQ